MTKKEEKSFSMTIQERDALIVEQLPEFTDKELEQVKDDLNRFFKQEKGQYFLLLSRDENYYTMFNAKSLQYDALAKEVHEFLISPWFKRDFGAMKVCKESQKGVMEIWHGTSVFLLFNADQLVVEV